MPGHPAGLRGEPYHDKCEYPHIIAIQKYPARWSGIKVNFGGFVPLSTVDWRGRSVCTVFFRGCPIKCSYCQNENILKGQDYRDLDEIKEMIKSSSPFISGVVFSGGEPTMQIQALIALAQFSKELKLDVGIQTNGFFPNNLGLLIEQRLVDKVALDFKSRWEGYSCDEENREFDYENYEKNVMESFKICKRAYARNILLEFEVVITVFYEKVQYINEISKKIEKVPLVLQQGEHKFPAGKKMDSDTTEGEYRLKKRTMQESYPPLTLDEIKQIANNLGRKVRIRTREVGEILYNSREGL